MDCLARSAACRGTVGHRTYSCKLLQPEREQGIGKELVDSALVALEINPEDPFYTRGLMPRNVLPVLPAISGEAYFIYRDDAGGILTDLIARVVQ